jgi:hypothetical protein
LIARLLLVTVGVFTVFLSALEGFHRAVEEVGGIALANHTLDFCPNWLLGVATGGFAVGLGWWISELVRRER